MGDPIKMAQQSSSNNNNNVNSSQKFQVEGESAAAFPIIAKILRTVPDPNAFYFYKQLGYYLDVKARSLGEFLETLYTIDLASIEFHSGRGDFENWISTTIGDATLTRQIYSCRAKKGEELRNSLISFVSSRLNRLQRFQ